MNCDFIDSTAHEVYLNILVTKLYKNKLKTNLHLLTYAQVCKIRLHVACISCGQHAAASYEFKTRTHIITRGRIL